MRTVLPWARTVTITAAGRGVSHDNGSQTMNERTDGRRDTSKHVVLNRNGFQTRSVLRLRDNCWISGGASCSGGRAGRGGDRPNRRPRERSLNASGIFTLDCGFNAWTEVNSALMGLGSVRLAADRCRYIIFLIVIVKRLRSFIISRLLTLLWGFHADIHHI